MRIKSLKARQIINSKGHPTLEVEIATNRNFAYSSVPIARSKSRYEYFDTYDNDLNRFNGETLNTIVDNINRVIASELVGKNCMDQENIDDALIALDNTLERTRLGVNTITAISQALARLGAKESDLPLFKYLRVLHDLSDHGAEKLNSVYQMPKPVVTIVRGGSHDEGSKFSVQEVMVLPRDSFYYQSNSIELFEAIDELKIDFRGDSVRNFLGEINEGLINSDFPLQYGLDMSASRFKRDDHTNYTINNLARYDSKFNGSPEKLTEFYLELMEKTRLSFLEDGLDEDDYHDWNGLLMKSRKIDSKIQIVSDDLSATNMERLEKISLIESANNVVIKPSQAGTISELIHFANRAKKHGLNITVSYRHGDTEDTFISDLAVGIGADFIRTGYYKGSEHNSKFNRLIRIEDSL